MAVDAVARARGGTALHGAVAHRQAPAVHALLAAGATPDVRAAKCETPLAQAVRLRCTAAVRAMAGATAASLSRTMAALRQAVEDGAESCAAALLGTVAQSWPLVQVALAGDEAGVETALAAGASVDGGSWKPAPLLGAVLCDSGASVAVLLASGADVHAPVLEQWRPLEVALRRRRRSGGPGSGGRRRGGGRAVPAACAHAPGGQGGPRRCASGTAGGRHLSAGRQCAGLDAAARGGGARARRRAGCAVRRGLPAPHAL